MGQLFEGSLLQTVQKVCQVTSLSPPQRNPSPLIPQGDNAIKQTTIVLTQLFLRALRALRGVLMLLKKRAVVGSWMLGNVDSPSACTKLFNKVVATKYAPSLGWLCRGYGYLGEN